MLSQSRPPYFPMMIDLQGRDVLVVGGGNVASRRADTLMRCGAKVTVIAPEIRCNAHVILRREFRPEDITENLSLVIAATDDRKINRLVHDVAKSMGIPVNVCDCQDECDFFFPSLVNCGNFAASVNSAGLSSSITHRLSGKLREVWPSWVREERASMIEYRDLSDGDVSICRDMCNALMKHQASKGKIYPEILAGINFDNRLKSDFDEAYIKKLIVAFDGEEPVGYIFAEIMPVEEEDKERIKPFADMVSPEDAKGFGLIPQWLKCPAIIGDLSNLYVRPEYRGLGIAKRFMNDIMSWFNSFSDVEYVFVYVSNGNDPAPFYERYGFRFSHDVLNGFLKSYSIRIYQK